MNRHPPQHSHRIPATWQRLLLFLLTVVAVDHPVAATGNLTTTTAIVLSNITWNLMRGETYGVVMRNDEPDLVPLTIGDVCILDSRLPKVLRFPDQPSQYVCSELSQEMECSLPTLSLGYEATASHAFFYTMNLSVAAQNSATSMSYAALFDTSRIVSWFATVRFSKLNASSSCMCIETIYQMDQDGTVSENKDALSLVSALNDKEGTVVTRELFAPCLFGVGLAGTPGSGAGPALPDALIFDAPGRTLVRFRDVYSLNTTHRLAWSKRYDGSVVDLPFLFNQSTPLSLNSWPLVPSSAYAAAMLDRSAPSLLNLWYARLYFCNADISELRYISNGVLRSSGVMLSLAWALTNIYVVFPVEMAKPIALRSSTIDSSKCTFTCFQQPAQSEEILFRAPCAYECELSSQFQCNASMTAKECAALDSIVVQQMGPLFVQRYDSDDKVSGSDMTGFSINISYFLTTNAASRKVIRMTTWEPYLDSDGLPSMLLGGDFATALGGKEVRFFSLDRKLNRIGLSPGVASTTIGNSTVSQYCVPVPVCGDNEVFISETNVCVSTTCSTFFFMKVNTETGQCSLRSDLAIAAGVLFLLSVTGELLVARMSSVTLARVRPLMGGKSAATNDAHQR